MNVAFLLHLYQPAIQSEATFRAIAEVSYLPLLRSIKNFKNFRLSLSIPLSLLEQMDKYGYSDWIADLKELIASGRVELVGGAAYHPLLPKLPQEFAERQVILNEFGLGYYFGRHSGFEGEAALLIKDLDGFFPPELAINASLLSMLSNLQYSWVLADECALPTSMSVRCGVYNLSGVSTKVVVRNRTFSNLLSFARTLDMAHFGRLLDEALAKNQSFVVALDGEMFGHHYSDGIALLSELLDVFAEKDIELVTVSEYVSSQDLKPLDSILESSWGATDSDILAGNPYPTWQSADNAIQVLQWDIVNKLISICMPLPAAAPTSGFETVPIWNEEALTALPESLRKEIERCLLIARALNSDQFWWASKKPLFDGSVLYNVDMLNSDLALIEKLVPLVGDTADREFILSRVQKIRELL